MEDDMPCILITVPLKDWDASRYCSDASFTAKIPLLKTPHQIEYIV